MLNISQLRERSGCVVQNELMVCSTCWSHPHLLDARGAYWGDVGGVGGETPLEMSAFNLAAAAAALDSRLIRPINHQGIDRSWW